MSKQCPPGVFCIENTTILFFIIIFVVIGYIVYQNMYNVGAKNINIINKIPNAILGNENNSTSNIFNDPYKPPLTVNQHFPQIQSNDVRGGIPINIKTRGVPQSYKQIGILTKEGNNENLILPLMGRISQTGRDKWNFYTISNSGSVNTKLPISVNGKSCSNEYGCDDIMNGETVYVEGYNDIFNVTKYENNDFQYIPVL